MMQACTTYSAVISAVTSIANLRFTRAMNLPFAIAEAGHEEIVGRFSVVLRASEGGDGPFERLAIAGAG